MEIISRKESIAAGLTRYFNGKPCRHGHLAPRTSPSGSCTECTGIRKRAKTLQKIVTSQPHRVIGRPESRSLDLPRYFTGKACKHGHVAERFTSTAICVECNRISAEKRRSIDPGYMKDYRENTKDRRNTLNRTIPERKAILKMREMVRRVVRLAGTDKTKRTIDILGYAPCDFIEKIESKFKTGMSWSNHGEWHIDHIIPVSVMVKRGVTDPAIINALDNLQPLWADENRRKSASIKNPS